MKLLIFTQKINKNDPILGFFHNWVSKIASKVETVNVVCLEKGEYDLPDNVKVFSLGKEEGRSKIKYIWHFYKYISSLEYDSVFIHMNQEYVLLGSIFWKLKKKKIVFWYNHTNGNILTKLAMLLSDIILHTSPFAFTAKTKKSKRMPAGIDTELFIPKAILKINNSILYLGRLDSVKKVDLILKAGKILKEKNINFVLNIYGNASKGSEKYEQKLYDLVSDLDLRERAFFSEPVPNFETPEIFSKHQVFVNMTPKGNYDKTVLEAMSCSSLAVVSSQAFSGAIDSNFIFNEDDEKDFAEKLEFVFKLSDTEKKEIGEKNRNYVINNESLDLLLTSLINILK